MNSGQSIEALRERIIALEKKNSQLQADLSMASERYFEALITEIPVMAHSIDKEGKILNVSNVWLHKMGYAKDQVIGCRSTEFLSKESQLYAKEKALPDYFKKGVAENVPYQFIKKDGTAVDVLMSAISIKDPEGAFTRSLAIMIDITERKKADEKADQQKRVFETMFNTIPDGVVITNTRREIQLANKGMEGTFGFKPEDLLGRSTKILYAGSRQFYETGASVFNPDAKKNDEVYVTLYRKKDGRKFPGETFGAKLYDEKKQWIGNLGIMRDITEREQAQRDLRQSEHKFRSLFENAIIGIAIVSKNKTGHFRIGDSNRAFQDFFEYTGDELRKISLETLSHPGDSEKNIKNKESLFNGERENYVSEQRFVCKDDKIKWGAITLSPVKSGSEDTVWFIVTINDITDRKNYKEERNRLQIQFQQFEKMESIGNLAGGIAHDFNNILFPILGLSEMLMEDFSPDTPVYKSAHGIFKAGKRGSNLVKQILTFSRQSEQKMSPIRIQAVLKEAVKFTRSIIPSNISFEQNIESDCGLVMADSTQLYQIAINLITNAYHATEVEGGTISILLKEVQKSRLNLPDDPHAPDRYVLFRVADTGVGIDPAIMDRVIEPYFTTKEEGKGTGLGLAVVYGIVTKHSGKLEIHSKPGYGTTVDIFLPLIKHKSEAKPPDKLEDIQGGSESILLVDDEEPILKLESQVLKRLGYRVTSCVSSLEALEVFRSDPDGYDLVISDMAMPDLTGERLAKKILSVRPAIPIIICTGFSETINDRSAKDSGISALLMKPVVKFQLAKTIRKLLDKKE